MTAFRITMRGEEVELRGHLSGSPERLGEFALAMEPFGVVIASFDDTETEEVQP